MVFLMICNDLSSYISFDVRIARAGGSSFELNICKYLLIASIYVHKVEVHTFVYHLLFTLVVVVYIYLFSGPWTKVGKYCYDLIRPDDPDELAPPQDFRGFYGVSQYWKLTVCSNYGNPQTRMRGVQFYGIGGSTLY